ncbi:multiple epidermal growth factor-like domains 10 [Elysia marginata]|uniref:Multiple epidermal growth factor-like domains 10 n=1 Tax=Elysia marginata TaxID=1093978 RepID=A0AAV4FVV2_9GAST|nr:multiple epidermal growth factor-like domains 10 [Elysia marginata]
MAFTPNLLFSYRKRSHIRGQITPDLHAVNIGLRMINYKFYWLDESIEALYKNEHKLRLSRKRESCGQINKDGYWIFTDCASVHSYFCEKSEVVCPGEWLPSYASGTCIKMFQLLTTWSGARHECNHQGGDLVMIMNADMNVFVHEQQNSMVRGSYWIGLSDITEEGKYLWLDGTDELNFTNWGNGQPNRNDEDDCVLIDLRGSWKETNCDIKHYYFCEAFSDCMTELFGMVCPVTCSSTNCAGKNKICSRKTGVCRDGCEAGYVGSTCVDECSSGKYGLGCNDTCSQNCSGKDSACHHVSGKCISGCKPGYLGDLCNEECPSGRHGQNCIKACSLNCLGPDNACHHVTGECVRSCKSGGSGGVCRKDPSDDLHDKLVIGALLATAVLSCISLITCLIKGKGGSLDNSDGGNSDGGSVETERQTVSTGSAASHTSLKEKVDSPEGSLGDQAPMEDPENFLASWSDITI